ncbi:MAG: hypothetical protein HGB12_06330 [Bacteroidetes bacterium]|nr:hypothetical protein [Bacteroidota bacterium]
MDPNRIELIENCLIYSNEIRNKQWGEQFGGIQEKLRSIDINELTIDFTSLKWIDPLPLLSLLISLTKFKKTKLILKLPNHKNSEYKNLTGFLYSEGFLNQFPSDIIIYSGEELVTDSAIFEKYVESLGYSNCSLIKAQVVDICAEISEPEYGLKNWISDIIFSSQSLIKNKVESFKAQEVISRLRILLSETISNIYEHAYGDNPVKLVGIYVRFRKGLGNTRVSKAEYDLQKKLIGKEFSNSPKLNRYFIDNIFSFIEVFVIDAGCGLSGNYFGDGYDGKYPFRDAWSLAVFKGLRGVKNRNKKTEFGGLHQIYKNLGNNYICARDSNEWIGHEAPTQETLSFYDVINPTVSNIKGFSVIYRLTWDFDSDEESYWTRLNFEITSIENHPFLQELKNSISIYERRYRNIISVGSFFVIDERFSFSKKICSKIYKNDNKSYDNCFFFPAKYMQKNEIFESISEYFQNVIVKSRTIIICDILTLEANLYLLGIENAWFPETITKNIDKIILFSERFSFLILEKDIASKKYKRSSALLDNSISNIDFLPHFYIVDLIAWIRTHDSLLFWELVKKKSDAFNLLYVNSQIEWYSENVDFIMDGYLNFAQIVSDADTRKLVECELSRTKCLVNFKNPNTTEYVNIDILTSQLASKMNTLLYYNYDGNDGNDSHKTKILLGSVFVSGQSQFDKEISILKERRLPIHFFIHKSIKYKDSEENINSASISNTFHLFLWPKDWLNKNFPFQNIKYRRVGRSHVIAPYGWKYFPIPRFRIYDKLKETYVSDFYQLENKSNGNYEFVCAYGDTPSEAYKEWQSSPETIEFGHYSYENKHDLLKIDFPLIVQNSFNIGGKLSVFLLGEFLIALGLNESSIISLPESSISIPKSRTRITNNVFDRRINLLKDSVKDYINKNTTTEECEIIVYPSHFNTESIIGKIKDCIDSNIHNRIISLIPINKERGSSAYLISPLILENIKSKIATYTIRKETVNVLLFDDGTIDGKTRKELKHLLFYLGADNVKTLCILDRRRLPFSTTIPNKHKAFWRMDTPRLGNRGECSLCEALKTITPFESQLIYSTHKSRIKAWSEAWDSQFPYSKRKNHGLVAKHLEKSITKKFSIYIDNETGKTIHHDEINLINSLGLTLYCTEIHSMTGRHDMALKICKNDDIEIRTRIEILSVNLLFFVRDFSDYIISEMAKLLLRLINLEQDVSNETALGALTFISLPFRLSKLIIYPFLEEDIDIKNIDMNLLMSYFIHNEGRKFENNSLQGNFFNSYTKDEKTAYHKLHHEIFNDFGINHNKSFNVIQRIHERSEIKKDLIDESISSCNRLYAIIKGFPISNTRKVVGHEQINDILNNLNKLASSFIQHFKAISKTGVPKYYYDDSMIFEEICNIQAIVGLTSDLIYNFHNELFVKVGLRENNDFPLLVQIKDLIYDCQNKYKEYKIGIANDFVQDNKVEFGKWIPMDRLIVKKIEFILTNVRHSKGFIDKDLNYINHLSAITQEYFNLVVSINYSEKGVNLKFLNFSENTPEYITEEANKKNKLEKEHISMLGGKLDYMTEKKEGDLFLINTNLFIPYA